jgi:hypothetical protein
MQLDLWSLFRRYVATSFPSVCARVREREGGRESVCVKLGITRRTFVPDHTLQDSCCGKDKFTA